MDEFWTVPKSTVCIPINVTGPDYEPQTTAPKPMDWYEAEWSNIELQGIDHTWFWFWPKHEGWAWRMVWNEKAIGPLEAA